MIRLTYRQKLEARSTAAAACMFLAPIPLVVGVVGVILDAPLPVACLVASLTLAHFAMSWRERVDTAWNEMPRPPRISLNETPNAGEELERFRRRRARRQKLGF